MNAAMPADVATLPQLFAWRVRQTPEAEAYRQYDRQQAAWVSWSWRQVAQQVGNWRRALHAERLPAGARVAILLPNGIDAVCADQACLAAGLVPVPMHALDNPASIEYILRDCGASVIVLDSAGQWLALQAAPPMPALQRVVIAGSADEVARLQTAQPSVPIVTLEAWLAAAAGTVDVAAPAPAADDVAAIVYTSGTTGRPKGVMLTHRNIVANVRAVLSRFTADPADLFLSMLPLSHTFERTVGYYLPIAAGACVAYVRSIDRIREDLQTLRPTVLVSVPRIYERVYAALQQQLSGSGALQRRLYGCAEQLGWRRFQRQQLRPAGGCAPADALIWPVLDRLVARKVRALFGGRLRLAVSGGAPLPPAVAHGFLAMGLPVLQGYGMTESSPVVCANVPDDNDPATVGRPLDGVEVRIGDDHELQVRAASVMKGYWNRPEDSRKALTEDGWLRSGDQAVIENGRIRIVGRIKEIIVTSTGEKIAPGDLENAVTANPLFEQAYAIGDNRPFIAIFVVLNPEQWAQWAARLGVAAIDASLQTKTVRNAALEEIRALTRHFPRYAVPRVVHITLDKWTVQNSLITPTLKLKRNALAARYAAEIDQIYGTGSHLADQQPATPSSAATPAAISQ